MAVKIIGSTLNLAPKEAALWSIDDYQRYVDATGYEGLTYYPIDNVLAAQIAMGGGKRAGNFISAFLQTWREDTRGEVAAKFVRRVAANHSLLGIKEAGFDAAMNMVMPHTDRSLASISRVQRRIGTEVLRPVVVHPSGQLFADVLLDRDGHKRQRPDYILEQERHVLGELQWQPTVELAHRRGVYSANTERMVDDLVALMREDGLGRASFDSNHAQAERQGMRFKDPALIAARLAATGNLGTFEVCVQPHLGGDIGHLESILNDDIASTPQGAALRAAAENTHSGDDFTMRVEVPAYAFDQLGIDRIEGHQELIGAIGEFAAGYLRAA